MKLFRQKMNTRFITFLLAVSSVAAFVCTAAPHACAAPASPIDTAKPCSLTVTTPADYPELAEPDDEGNPKAFTVNAWLVATVDDTLTYTLTEKFSSEKISVQGYELKDLNDYKMSAETTDLNKITELAEALYGTALGIKQADIKESSSTGYAPDAGEGEGKPALPVGKNPEAFAIEPDYTFTVTGGTGSVEGVPAGYYLLVPDDYYDEEYVYTYGPTLVSAPHLDMVTPQQSGGEGETPPSEPYEDWVYAVNARLKPEKNPRTGYIKICKSLISYNIDLAGAEFVFAIDGKKDGKSVYSDVILLRFDGEDYEKEYYVYDLPVGTEVTVEEVYSGSAYKLTEPSKKIQTKPVVANDGPNEDIGPIEFTFTNSPDDEIPKGIAVRNSYELSSDGEEYHATRMTTDSTGERNHSEK